MSRRTNKKRLKKINQAQTAGTAAAASTPAKQTEEVQAAASAPAKQTETVQAEAVTAAESSAVSCEVFLQYQNLEFDITDISARILDKCSAENMDSSDLRIYVKPEDKKAYYVCAGGNSFIDL